MGGPLLRVRASCPVWNRTRHGSAGAVEDNRCLSHPSTLASGAATRPGSAGTGIEGGEMTHAPGLVVVPPQEGREVLALGNTHRNKAEGWVARRCWGVNSSIRSGAAATSSRRGPDRDKFACLTRVVHCTIWLAGRFTAGNRGPEPCRRARAAELARRSRESRGQVGQPYVPPR